MDSEGGLWNGATIRDLLDRLDPNSQLLANSNTMKAKVEVEAVPAPETAFLGPKLWQKPISLQQFNEDDFFVMNIDDFLAENDLQKEKLGNALKEQEGSPEPEQMRCTNPSNLREEKSPEPEQMRSNSLFNFSLKSPISPGVGMEVMSPQAPAVPSPRPGVIVSTKDCKKNLLPKGDNGFLYAESKRAKIEREKEENRRRLEVDMEFAPEDLALATVPGVDFNPRERAFNAEELRPQPIIRKRPKLLVAEDNKDERYWEKRCKNNVAARRSREARRLKENQIALRAAFLEKQNAVLMRDLDEAYFDNTKLAMERDILRKKLAKYEAACQ